MAYRLGVDIGGTFTDLILLREVDGEVFTAKVPSTPDDPSRAVFDGIEKIFYQLLVRLVGEGHGIRATPSGHAALDNPRRFPLQIDG